MRQTKTFHTKKNMIYAGVTKSLFALAGSIPIHFDLFIPYKDMQPQQNVANQTCPVSVSHRFAQC